MSPPQRVWHTPWEGLDEPSYKGRQVLCPSPPERTSAFYTFSILHLFALKMSSSSAPRPSGAPAKRARIASNPSPPDDLVESFDTDAAGVPPRIDEVDMDMSMASLLDALPEEDRSVHFRHIGHSHQNAPLSESDVVQWVGHLSALTSFRGPVDPLDMVIVREVLGHDDDAFKLSQMAVRAFKGATIPKAQRLHSEGWRASFYTRSVAKRGGTLTGGKEVMHRALKNRSFVWTVPLGVAWPPPVTMGPEPGCDDLWYFEIPARKDVFEADLCGKLIVPLSAHFEGYLFRVVCPNWQSHIHVLNCPCAP